MSRKPYLLATCLGVAVSALTAGSAAEARGFGERMRERIDAAQGSEGQQQQSISPAPSPAPQPRFNRRELPAAAERPQRMRSHDFGEPVARSFPGEPDVERPVRRRVAIETDGPTEGRRFRRDPGYPPASAVPAPSGPQQRGNIRPGWSHRDHDGDGVRNGRDSDRDGDGRPNWRDHDRNNDGRRDWGWRDRDRDGVRNRHDWDRDNDGKPNWRDGRRKHDVWRHWHRPRPSYVIVRPGHGYHYRPYWWGSSYYLFDNRYDGYGYDYGNYYRPGYGYYGGTHGSGWSVIYPWLRNDPAARHWVLWNFDDNRNGRLGKEEARRANREFERYADWNRDGYLSDREISRGLDDLRNEYRYSYYYG
jgi:hypothetical protein